MLDVVDVQKSVGGILKSVGPRVAQIADARGLAMIEQFIGLQLRPGVFDARIDPDRLEAVSGGVPLVAGEETQVPLVVQGLPPNADVKKLKVRMRVFPAGRDELPPPETAAVRVTAGEGPAQDFSVEVTPPTLPRNVQVRLDGGEPVWSHGGTLESGSHDLPDIAEAVNAFLDSAQQSAGQPTTLSFLVRSETPGRASFEVVPQSLDYTMLQTQTWPNPLDQSVQIDRSFALEFGSVFRVPLQAPPSSGGLRLVSVRADVSGDTGPERLLGDVPAHDGREFATVSSDYALAQAFRIPAGGAGELGFVTGSLIGVPGVSLLAEVAETAEVYVEIQRDAGGAPANEPPPLGSVSLELAPPEGPPGPRWTYVALSAPAEVPVDAPCWIVVRGIRASVRVAVAAPAAYLQGLLVNRGGQLWKPLRAAPAAAALMRLAYLPEPDSRTAPVAIGLEGVPPQRPEIGAQSQRLTFAPSAAQPAIVVTSHARGNLALANVVQEFGRS